MTLLAVTRDTVLRAASGLAFAITAMVAPALAGDRAMVEFIGYSPDAKYFAFEEYGEEDGSGFPYSNIYIVDLDNDQWVGESPYRIVLEDESATVTDARAAAYDAADAAINEFTANLPVYVLALNGDGDARTGAGEAIDFGQPGYGLSEMLSSQTLGLGVFPRPSSEDCSVIADETYGFSLAIDGEEIYADGQKLPKSRGCPMGYKIYAVLTPAEWSVTQGGTVAIISYYPFGFEGPDRRFLAVPLGQ